MFLKQLNLVNFRNYSVLNLDFDQRPTIFVGNNAAGKSNILEAIYLLSTSKSLRVENEDELIKEGEEFAKVEGFIEEGGEMELLVVLNRITDEVKFRKKALVNGISKRVLDFIGNLPAVIFYPSDINLVTGAPSLRRWHLDLALAQVDPQYKHTLTHYEQFLFSRNRILKRIREGFAKIDELDYWTDGLVEKGEALSVKRKEFFEYINSLEKPLGEFGFEYIQSEISVDLLKEKADREIAAAQTIIGPHRDDFDIVILNGVKDLSRMRVSNKLRDSSLVAQNDGGRSLRHFGSRGEQRTATLAFKLAQLEYMAEILGKRPILLLDDVFSELDANHRQHVIDIVAKQQTIISTVELENIPQSFLDSARILRVENGMII